jgi:surfactin synthase thioesterase subunit
MITGRWLVCRHERPRALLDLYCFPHAGGAPGEYARWSDDLPGVQVSGLQPPGRGARLDEEPFVRMPPLVDAVLEHVTFREPFVLFGHSLGALVAFEVARTLHTRGHQPPERLVVSSCPAPPLSFTGRPLHTLPDDELLAAIEQRWEPLPPELRADPDFLALLLSRYRADFELLETYRGDMGKPLDLPITAVVGAEEPHHARVADWAGHTRQPSDLAVVPGGHFHPRQGRGLLHLLQDVIYR